MHRENNNFTLIIFPNYNLLSMSSLLDSIDYQI